jgi:signal transduction histidine kinase/ligand-binding sensor domain-containing protein
MSLFRARDGTVWVGFGGSAGIGRIQRGQLKLYGAREGIHSRYIVALFEDHTGAVWAGGRDGLYRFRNETWESLGPAGPVLAMHEDRRQQLWVATSLAIFQRVGQTDTFRQVNAVAPLNNLYADFSQASDGALWITDLRKGFRRLSDLTPPERRPARPVWGVRLLHDRHETLWVATQGQGLWRIRTPSKDGRPFVDMITTREGLPSDSVFALHEDTDGNIWVGTAAGLLRFSARRVQPLTNFGLVRAVEASRDGGVWVGTTAGVTRISAGNRKQYGETEGLPGSIVLAMHVDPNGVLWVATNRGLSRFVNDRFVAVPVPNGVLVQRAFAMTSTTEGLWLVDREQGLRRLHEGILLRPAGIDDAPPTTISTIYGDSHGALWIGYQGGRLTMLRSDGEVTSFRPTTGTVRALYEDKEGGLWIGGERGLSRLANGRLVAIGPQNGFSESVNSVVGDGGGFVWVGVDSGLVRLDRAEVLHVAADPRYQVHYRMFDTGDGVAGRPIPLGSPIAVRSRDEKVWFVTSSGITVVDPRRIGDAPAPPRVHIETVTADAKSLDPRTTRRLPPRISQLRIDFTAALADPMRARFRYWLEGFDNDWVQAGTIRQASYTNLPPGDYRFRVAASRNDGVWNEAASTWAFTIEPMFYQTRWFYAICAAAAALLAWGAWQLRARQLRHQLAAVLAERIRMSRTIHDTLLQGMVGIALQFDDLAHSVGEASPAARDSVSRLRRQVEEYIRDARSSIWHLRTPALQTRDLVSALRDAGERTIGTRPVRFEITTTGVPQRCPPRVEEQVLLIGQEALSNAVRHGAAKEVRVDLEYAESQLRLQVCDDGVGFDLAAASSAGGHYGLIGMQERAAQVRGQVRIVTRPGGGTIVETRVPTSEKGLILSHASH